MEQTVTEYLLSENNFQNQPLTFAGKRKEFKIHQRGKR